MPGEISRFKYDELNGDGIYDGEPGVPGVTITLEGTDGMGNPVSMSTTTDGSGQFWFTDLPPGTYWVNETVPAGAVATTSISYGPIVLESGDLIKTIAGRFSFFVHYSLCTEEILITSD